MVYHLNTNDWYVFIYKGIQPVENRASSETGRSTIVCVRTHTAELIGLDVEELVQVILFHQIIFIYF